MTVATLCIVSLPEKDVFFPHRRIIFDVIPDFVKGETISNNMIVKSSLPSK